MPRDPRLHPLPGDAFQDRDGLTWRVLDRFVSVDADGEEHPGVFCAVETDDGDEKPLCLAVGVFAAKVREHRVIERGDGADDSWTAVPRVPQAKVGKLMRDQHGFD